MASRPRPTWLELSPSVAAARRRRQAVVALESAVLTHGLPPSERLPIAQQLEDAVRQAGAVPAFIALLTGKARVGLSAAEVKTLAETEGVSKCARADLGWLLAQKVAAGMTVSSTLFVTAGVGIEVAATGGIGGVHRDAAHTFDVSADLVELTRAPVTLVCSGAKAMVDLRKTLEFLESQSVPVIGFKTGTLPGFFARETGFRLRAAAGHLAELAATVRSYRTTGYRGAILVANPVPAEAALPAVEVELLVEQALRQASEQGVSGSAVTPFLLRAMNQLSGGATLKANKALLLSNAALAARLAAALAHPRTRA